MFKLQNFPLWVKIFFSNGQKNKEGVGSGGPGNTAERVKFIYIIIITKPFFRSNFFSPKDTNYIVVMVYIRSI